MIGINLLPWRKTLAEQQKKVRQYLLISGFSLIALITLLVYVFMAQKVRFTKESIDLLQRKKESFLFSQNKNTTPPLFWTIEKLKNDQKKMIRFLKAVSIQEMHWTKITYEHGRAIIIGKADAYSIIFDFLKKHPEIKMIHFSNKQAPHAAEYQLETHLEKISLS